MKDISVFQQSANYTYIQKYKALQINARCRGIGKTVAVNVRDRSNSNALKLKIEYGYTKRVMKDGYTVVRRNKNKKFKDNLLNCR